MRKAHRQRRSVSASREQVMQWKLDKPEAFKKVITSMGFGPNDDITEAVRVRSFAPRLAKRTPISLFVAPSVGRGGRRTHAMRVRGFGGSWLVLGSVRSMRFVAEDMETRCCRSHACDRRRLGCTNGGHASPQGGRARVVEIVPMTSLYPGVPWAKRSSARRPRATLVARASSSWHSLPLASVEMLF